jgi:hypothetical protein
MSTDVWVLRWIWPLIEACGVKFVTPSVTTPGGLGGAEQAVDGGHQDNPPPTEQTRSCAVCQQLGHVRLGQGHWESPFS